MSPTGALIVVGAAFIVSLMVTWLLVKIFPRLQFKQTAYEDAPQTHQQKTGTPTMGGIGVLAPMMPAFLYASPLRLGLWILVFGAAAIGFVDDVIGIRAGKNRGLRARTKYLATALVAVIFLRIADSGWYHVSMGAPIYPRDAIFHASTYVLTVPHWAWLLLGIVAITGTIHAVNLTDGLDGLLAGTMIPPLIAFYLVAVSMVAVWEGDDWPLMILLAVGGCFGFLVYNRHPAKIFMGDTGSLALGALLSGVAILTGEMLLLVLIGGVFVAEALSVILQVTYFKRTGGKRIFRMSPLHHHFELAGWPETTVTARFWLASVILSGLGLAIVR